MKEAFLHFVPWIVPSLDQAVFAPGKGAHDHGFWINPRDRGGNPGRAIGLIQRLANEVVSADNSQNLPQEEIDFGLF